MEHRNILFHRVTEEWKSTDIGPEFFDPSGPSPPEESPSSKTHNGDKRQHTYPEPWLCDIPMQFGQKEKQSQQMTRRFESHDTQNVPSQQVPLTVPLQQKLHSTQSQEMVQSMQQQNSQTVPSQQHLQDNLRCNDTISRSLVGCLSSSPHISKHADVPDHIPGFLSSDFKNQADEIIPFLKKETDALRSLVMHLRNQLAQKDREIDALTRRADAYKPELLCLKEKYSNLRQSFATVKNQMDTTKSMCLSLEKSIAEQTKEQELLKEQCEEQNQTIKNLQSKLQKKTSEVASLENALNVEQSRQTPIPEEAEAIAKYNAREEIAERFKEDMRKQDELLELERNKNLETINRMQLTTSMFEEQKKALQAENNQLQQLCEQLDLNAQEMISTIKSQQQQLAKKNDELIGMKNEMLNIRMRNEEITYNYQKMIESLKAELLQKDKLYDEVKAKLEEAGAHCNEVQGRLSEASAKIQQLKDDNTILQDHLRKTNAEIQKGNLEKQANEEKLIEARQVMTSLRDKVETLEISHSKEINLFKQTISDLENIISRKDDIIAEQQEEMRKTKCYIFSLESELANVNEQARLEREKHKTLSEKAGLLSEFLDKSSETLTEKQQEVWALKRQLEANKRLSTVVEERVNQETSGIVTYLKDESERYGSSEITEERNSLCSIEDLKENLKYKEQCLQELANTVMKIGLEARQREAELQQEILRLKNVINKKEAMLSYQEQMLAQAQYDLSINKAILREADITIRQKEIELEKEKQRVKEAVLSKKDEKSLKTKAAVQDPLLLTTIEKSESTDEVDSTDSHGSCLIYETEICLLKDLHRNRMGSRKDPATSTPRKTQCRDDLVTAVPSNIQTEIVMEADATTKTVKDLEKLGENLPQPSGSAEFDSDKQSMPAHNSNK